MEQTHRQMDTQITALLNAYIWGHNNYYVCHSSWQHGIVVSGIRCINKVCQAWLLLGWVTVCRRYTILVCNLLTRSTQPCIPPGSVNGVTAAAGVKATMSPMPGGM